MYTDVKQLRYGHLMIMTDQDHDGSHIKGLIMNFFHHFYPSLLQLPGFLLEFITPIVKVPHERFPGCSQCVRADRIALPPFGGSDQAPAVADRAGLVVTLWSHGMQQSTMRACCRAVTPTLAATYQVPRAGETISTAQLQHQAVACLSAVQGTADCGWTTIRGMLKVHVELQASRKGRTLAFYTIPEYEAWREQEGVGWSIKYYKGVPV